jgi:exonuclease VII large subunit
MPASSRGFKSRLNALGPARTLCRTPLPFLTELGHERDETLLDEVARG